MAELSTKPGSSSKKAHTALVCAARARGFTVHDVRKVVGGSICKLSAAECSEWIKRYSGRDLPNPPGKKPGVYKGKKKTPGTVRMITDDQVEQIHRLGLEHFSDACGYPYAQDFAFWLARDFKLEIHWARDKPTEAELKDQIRRLATAKRGGQVIAVLKEMHNRRNRKQSRDRKGADTLTKGVAQ